MPIVFLAHIASIKHGFPAKGLIFLASITNGVIFLRFQQILKYLKHGLKRRGFEIELSGAGRILLKIIDSVGGIHGIRTFQDEEIIKLLDKMSHAAVESEIKEADDEPVKSKVRAKTVSVKTWKDLLIKLNHNSAEVAERHFRNLINYKILKGGVNLQCPECAQHTWYALDDLSDRVTCERCLEKFDFPIVRPISKDNWHLRTIGPFSVENYAQGGYSVALSLRFFADHQLSTEMTWIPSFSIKKKDSMSIEADFGIFYLKVDSTKLNLRLLFLGNANLFSTNLQIKILIA